MAPDPDPDAPDIAPFSPAEMPNVRPYLPSTWTHYVDGDFYGLQNLATQLYDVALKGNPLVDRLRLKVNEILGMQNDARWTGESAGNFRASYGQDSSMLSALGKVIAAAAGSTQAMQEFVQKRRVYQKQADEAREVAAAELLRIGDILMEMLGYYQKKSKIGSLNPGGLLNEGQFNWYSPRIVNLAKQLKLEREHIEGAKVDVKDIGKDMQKIGGGAETIGGLMGLIEPLKPAGDAVSSVGGVVAQLGEVTEHFG